MNAVKEIEILRTRVEDLRDQLRQALIETREYVELEYLEEYNDFRYEIREKINSGCACQKRVHLDARSH